MDLKLLANVLRARARRLLDREDAPPEARDDAELFLVLARLLEGKPVDRAFGAPGDWGYGTEIGDALAQLYRTGRGPYPSLAAVGGASPVAEDRDDGQGAL